MEITRGCGPILGATARQGLVDAVVRFLTVRQSAGIPYKPKMHQMVHLAYQSGFVGNPRCIATWVDEGLNMELAAVCRSAHTAVWSRRVLATFAHYLGPTSVSSSGADAKRPRRLL